MLHKNPQIHAKQFYHLPEGGKLNGETENVQHHLCFYIKQGFCTIVWKAEQNQPRIALNP